MALSAEEVAWLEQEAQRQGVSVSAVVSQTIQFSLRDVAWRRCCAALGWPESLSHDEAAAADADLKAMGLL